MTTPAPAAPSGRPARYGLAAGALAMTFVGGSVAVSSVLRHAPLYLAESLRYGVASALLLVYGRLSGKPLSMPRRWEWAWLTGVTVTGLVMFNIALVRGSAHAQPAALGVAVACVPALFAILGPLLEGRRPRPRAVTAGLVVTGGAVLVQGLGHSDGAGIAWAAVVFACEAGFTLLALPVLGRHGPGGVSVHTTWMAAVIFAVMGAFGEGPGAWARLGPADLLAVAYLALAVTAAAFVLWYSCVALLGPGRAGLLTGVAPIAAALVGIALGGPVPGPGVWAGAIVVAAGLALGLGGSAPPKTVTTAPVTLGLSAYSGAQTGQPQMEAQP